MSAKFICANTDWPLSGPANHAKMLYDINQGWYTFNKSTLGSSLAHVVLIVSTWEKIQKHLLSAHSLID